jgi:competence protein ComEA
VTAPSLASSSVLETPATSSPSTPRAPCSCSCSCSLGARYLGRDGEAASREPAPTPSGAPLRLQEAAGGRVTVHVAGAVRRPDFYRLGAGARVEDAVARAGGARRGADLGAVNLAAKLEDGRQVIVPARAPPAAAGATASSSPAPGVPLNLNTGTLEQLDELDGIGPGTAQQILAYREEHGGFGSVDELAQIAGIGEKRMATLRAQVRV